MSIIGHGIDIIETIRIKRLLDQHGQHFLDRVFTKQEQAYAQQNPRRFIERLAARFAAKESVLKVLGTGKRGSIAWTDIEVTKTPTGQPGIHLTGQCAQIATEMGIVRWHVSLSHIADHAIASAIGLRT
jgi:holo-[acyl-carrier protein] synthase